MNFENGQLTYVHLVSWPSVWLPPLGTYKLLFLGFETNEIELLSQTVGETFGEWNWAFYYISEMDPQNQEHVDWLLINCHIDYVVTKGNNHSAILMAAILKRSHTFCIGDDFLIDRVCNQLGWTSCEMMQIFGLILAQQSQQGSK